MNEKIGSEKKFLHEIFVKNSPWKLRLIRDYKYLCAPLNRIASDPYYLIRQKTGPLIMQQCFGKSRQHSGEGSYCVTNR